MLDAAGLVAIELISVRLLWWWCCCCNSGSHLGLLCTFPTGTVCLPSVFLGTNHWNQVSDVLELWANHGLHIICLSRLQGPFCHGGVGLLWACGHPSYAGACSDMVEPSRMFSSLELISTTVLGWQSALGLAGQLPWASAGIGVERQHNRRCRSWSRRSRSRLWRIGEGWVEVGCWWWDCRLALTWSWNCIGCWQFIRDHGHVHGSRRSH